MKTPSIFLASLLGSPLALTANDNFAEATPINFLNSQATMTVAGTNATATAEDGEPAHAGVTASASFWYALTVDQKRRVEIAARPGAAGPLSNIVLAVYTGDSLADLQPAKRYKKFSLPATSRSLGINGEPFVAYVRLSLDAKAGTTYYIAVDGESGSKGTFDLTLSTSRDPLTPRLELVPTRASWSYYQALSGTNASNPATADTDFYTTWHTAADYNGPAFLGPSASPFGYGTINAVPNRGTTLTTPASGQRQAVTYFRTTFIPEKGVQGLGFEGALDDGAVIYINGTEVTRMNVTGGTLLYNSTAIAANFTISGGTLGTEEEIQYATVSGLNLLAGEEVEIGVSLHNAGTTSSDSGFHMRVYATETDPDPIILESFPTEFENTYKLVWEGEEDTSYNVEFTENSLEEGSWAVTNTIPITATEDGPVQDFVFSPGARGFWRIVTIAPAE